MAIVFVVVFSAILGAIHNDWIQYWLSQLVTVFRRKDPMVGEWEISYQRDEKPVTEHLNIYATFDNVAYGRLTAKLLADPESNESEQVAEYRVRIEHCFDNIHALTLKPASKSFADIGMGLVHFDPVARSAEIKLLGLSRDRLNKGEDIYLREASAVKAPNILAE